jgi:hypothetical protein
MDSSIKEIVYSKNVIEFVTIAKEYTAFVEQSSNFESHDFIDKTLKILSLLYLKTNLLPVVEPLSDEGNEKYVTELDWQYIRNGVQLQLADNDIYLDFFDSEMNETPEPVSCSVSENLSDIYQDLKDFLEIYQLGNEELSNDAIYECNESFKNYWGFKLVNSLRILHHLSFNEKGIEFAAAKKMAKSEDDWFISRAQQGFRKDD